MAVLQLYGLPVLQADHPGLRYQSAEGLRSLPVDGNNPLTGGDGAANRFYSFHTGVAAGVELDKGIALQKLQQPPYFFRPCFFANRLKRWFWSLLMKTRKHLVRWTTIELK